MNENTAGFPAPQPIVNILDEKYLTPRDQSPGIIAAAFSAQDRAERRTSSALEPRPGTRAAFVEEMMRWSVSEDMQMPEPERRSVFSEEGIAFRQELDARDLLSPQEYAAELATWSKGGSL